MFGTNRLGRTAAIGVGLAVLLACSIAIAASPPGVRLVNVHKLSPASWLGKRPTRCKTFPESGCIQTGSYGSVHLSPHILRPGQVLTATVKPTGCHACSATWPVSGKTAPDLLFRYLKRLRCGALKCKWRNAKNAPPEPYLVVHVAVSPRPTNGASDVTDYVGVRSTYRLKYFP